MTIIKDISLWLALLSETSVYAFSQWDPFAQLFVVSCVQVSLSAFAFLFSELVQYNQGKVENISDLEHRFKFICASFLRICGIMSLYAACFWVVHGKLCLTDLCSNHVWSAQSQACLFTRWPFSVASACKIRFLMTVYWSHISLFLWNLDMQAGGGWVCSWHPNARIVMPQGEGMTWISWYALDLCLFS